MCFGSGAPKYKKPEFDELPSTRVERGDRKAPVLKDVEVVRKGKAPRSLLNPYMADDV